jgi:hypothetical protein
MLTDGSNRTAMMIHCYVLVAVVMALTCCRASTTAPAEDAGSLFTPQEAHDLRLAPGEWAKISRSRAISLGPQIVIKSPRIVAGEVPTIEAQSPTALDVRFEPRAAPVRMESLDVEARKGFFSKSLTEMLRPYIHGDSIELSKVEIPSGNFMLDISIADTSGNVTEASYRLEVGG